MNFHLIRHATVDSTSERAFAALADKTARHGDVHVADAQTAGRGRQGRRWHSPSAGGLYCSIILLPREPLSASGLTIAAGLAVHDAVVRLGLADAALEWPNDVIVRAAAHPSAKLAGILVETRGLDPKQPHYVVGVGVNVAQRAFPAELTAERAVTSLALQGFAATNKDMLEAVLQALPARLAMIQEDARGLARDYLAATALAGARVRVRAGDALVEGRIGSLDLEHGLVVLSDDGRARTLALEVVREITAIGSP